MKAQDHYPLTASLLGDVISSGRRASSLKLRPHTFWIVVVLVIGCLASWQGFGQLKGTYTIDSTKAASKTNYGNIQSAFSDLNSGSRTDGGAVNGTGVSGPVVFKIADGAYIYPLSSTNPTFLYTTSIPGTSSTNTVTFTSASGDSSKVLLRNCIFNFVGVANIMFSEICFDQRIPSIDLPSISMNGSTNIRFTHCQFLTGKGNGGIFIYDTDTNFDVSVDHCNFEGSGISLFMNYCSGLRVTDNIIRNAPVSSGLSNDHYMFYSGFGNRNLLLKNNTFLKTADTAFTISECNGLNISNNRIEANVGMDIGDGYYGGNDSIINNTMLTHHYGIYNQTFGNGTTNMVILYNNIYTDSVGVSGSGACLWAGNCYGAILNNNFENGPGRAAINFPANSINSIINYNNYYSLDSFGYYGAKFRDFASFQKKTGLETNGLTLDPKYNFNKNLMTGTPGLEGKGKVISSVKYDISGNIRNALAPTVGAYEITYSDSIAVWPGDANNDGKVDINDLLAIGVTYNFTGPNRVNATTNWTPQLCNDWTNNFKNGTNVKFADCNGDGQIDSTDISVIALNFSKQHYKSLTPASGNPSDPPLTVKFSKDSVQAGDSITALISLGSSSIRANNVYGVTLSVSYGAFMFDPKSISTDFTKSWLGTLHKDMVALVVNDSVNKIIHIGLTRTDHSNISGAGNIGVVSIYMPDNVAGKREVKQYFNLEILDYKLIDQNQDTILLNPKGDSTVVFEYKAGIADGSLKNPGLSIYPNPARSSINVVADNTLINNIIVTDVMGKTVCESLNNGAREIVIPVSSLSSGVYFMDIMTKKGVTRAKFIKE